MQTAKTANKGVVLVKKPSGVALLLLDGPGKANLLGSEAISELAAAVDFVGSDGDIAALAIASGKPDTFVSGADLHEISRLASAAEAEALSASGQALFSAIASLNKPTVVGINGTCLGGGLELALCCDRRIAADGPGTLIGLPEVRLGIIPGLGGTQRLPRLIGLKAALEMVLSSEPVGAPRALEMGLVDEVVEAGALIGRLEECALELCGDMAAVRARRQRNRADEELSRPKQKALLSMAERSVRIKTRGHYPAHARAIDVMARGLEQGIDEGLRLESAAFGELAVSDVSRNLVALFFAGEFARASAAAAIVRAGLPAVRQVGIAGSGKMGAAIAQAAAASGFDVVMFCRSPASADRALAEIRASLPRPASGQAEEGSGGTLERIRTVTGLDGLASSDLVIECLPEDLELKREIVSSLLPHLKPDCLIATNTSSLSVASLSRALPCGERLLGLHFFQPVDRMPLVEVVSHDGVARDAQARLLSFAAALGKVPLSVKDSPGFLVNRLLTIYLIETARLCGERVPLNWIEDAARDFGMPVGPLELLDEVGLDLAFKVAGTLHSSFGAQFAPPPVLLAARDFGMAGKAGGRGVYIWDENGRKSTFDPELIATLNLTVSESKCDAQTAQGIAERLMLPMADEAARCLEAKIVRRPREIDLALVSGIGFPAFRGGILRWADRLGIAAVVTRLDEIYATAGDGRQVCGYLRRLASEKRRFYSAAGEGD